MAKRRRNTAPPTPDPKGRCGTRAGYAAHHRRGERACEDCKRANSALEHQRRAEKLKADRERREAEIASWKPVTVVGTTSKLSSRPKVDVVNPDPTPAPDPDLPTPPDYLRAKGRDLWESVTRAYDLTPAALTLLGEACRTTDRLERMAAALSSRSTLWFELEPCLEDNGLDGGENWTVTVNGMIGEARQLQTALRQTLNQLGVVGVENNGNGRESVLDQLAQRRAERRAMAEGQ